MLSVNCIYIYIYIHDFYHLHLGPKSLMVNGPFGSVHGQSNGPVNSDLTESWWTCAIQWGCVFGLFGWTNGGPHKCELTKFYPIYIFIYMLQSIAEEAIMLFSIIDDFNTIPLSGWLGFPQNPSTSHMKLGVDII